MSDDVPWCVGFSQWFTHRSIRKVWVRDEWRCPYGCGEVYRRRKVVTSNSQ